MDAPIEALIDARRQDVTVENAAAIETAIRNSIAALRVDENAAAGRIAAACRTVSIADVALTSECHSLLRFVENTQSVALLTERAMIAIPDPPEDAHVTQSAPEALARQSAIDALAVRAGTGSTAAVEALAAVAQDGDERARGAASEALLVSVPRREAKRLLREALPPDELWRLYEVRP